MIKRIIAVSVLSFIFMSMLAGCGALSELVTGQKEIAPPANFIRMESGEAADGTLIENGFLDEEKTRPAQKQTDPVTGEVTWIEVTDPKAIKIIQAGSGLLGYGGIGDAIVAILGAFVTVAGAGKTKEIVVKKITASKEAA